MMPPDFIWHMSPSVPVLERPPKAERSITSTPEIERLRSALGAIPNDKEPLDYDEWFRVVCALHHATEGSPDGLALAHEFSARSGKYEPEFLDSRVWDYLGVSSADPITAQSLFSLAGQHGWQDPSVADDFDVIEDDAVIPVSKNPDRFAFVQAAQFSAGKSPGWIIKNVLPRAELVCLFGESGSGKTFLMLDLLGSIAQGIDWRGHRTTQGLRAGYIAAEGAAGFRNRLQAYANHYELDLSSLPLAIMAGAPNFTQRDDILDLGLAMKAYGPLDVLVVDTLAQVTAGANENSGEDMGRVIAHCKTLHAVTGATIVLVHHSGKDASRGARGWSGLKGALDAELEVSRNDNDRMVTISKLKDGTGEGAQYGFRLLEVPLGTDEDGDIYGSCVVEAVDVSAMQKGRSGPKSKNEITLHKIVLDLMDVGEEPTLGEVLSEYENRVPLDPLVTRDNRRTVANKALRALIDKGIIEAHGARLGLPQQIEETKEEENE